MRTILRLQGVVVAVVAISVLSACSSQEASGDIATLSLAESKSPVQLLRNAAAALLPEETTEVGFSTDDTSVACRDAESDPKGIYRQWQSTAIVTSHDGVDLARGLATRLAADDWTSRESSNDESSYRAVLSKPSSTASIHLDATTTGLEIWINGPCVVTDGAKSEEVTSLENLD